MSASLDHAGALEVVCVPKGSEWSLTLRRSGCSSASAVLDQFRFREL